MRQKKVKYPIGISTFSEIIEDGWLYVDKTEYVYDMANENKYIFLARPRRFGKSLLVSTLQSYFEGRKDLFEGLALGELETAWKKYPVFRFDMSEAKCENIEDAKLSLSTALSRYESIYGKNPVSDNPKDRLVWLIEEAHRQTGMKAVLLIDEYDSPMLKVMDDEEKYKKVRDFYREFYSPIKSSDAHLRFGFITGITKFSQLSIFSEINNLRTISMTDKYSGVCGITKSELLTALKPQIETMARERNVSFDEMFVMLKDKYDGYRFSEKSEEVFNPFSLLYCFSEGKLKNYWFPSGTPTWLVNKIKKANTQIESLEYCEVGQDEFDAPTDGSASALPLLYHSGYLTIKKYDEKNNIYTLGIPNNEVRTGLFKNLAIYYLSDDTTTATTFANRFGMAIKKNELSDALHLIRSFISCIPYSLFHKDEKSYHIVFYIISKMVCGDVQSEVQSSNGRSDMVLKSDTHIYVFEFKYMGKIDKALLQIDNKGYLIQYETDSRKVIKVAVNFNKEEKVIDGWAIDDGETVQYEIL